MGQDRNQASAVTVQRLPAPTIAQTCIKLATAYFNVIHRHSPEISKDGPFNLSRIPHNPADSQIHIYKIPKVLPLLQSTK